MSDEWKELHPEDARALLAEVRAIRRKVDLLEVKREALAAARLKTASLRKALLEDVRMADEIEQDITEALNAGSETTNERSV